MAGPVFLIAQQRSGTNLFRHSLASTPWFIDRDEVFHDRPDMGTYWTHRALMIAQDPQLSIPHPEHQNKIFESFLATFACAKDAFTLFDVKYNSLHNLNPVWQSHGLRPHLFTVLAERQIPVVHLVRRDFLATYVSDLVARESKIFVTKTNDLAHSKSLTINVFKLILYVRLLTNSVQRIRNWLKHSTNIPVLQLNFEDLLDEQGNMSRQVLGELESFLKIPDKLRPQVMTKKIITRPYWELIENFESEVVPALKTNGLAHLLPPQFADKEAA